MTTQHKCPWPLCVARVDADLWGCKQHWYMIPPPLRETLWKAYRPGQTLATASREYLDAAGAIDIWVALYFQTVGPKPKLGRPRKQQGTLPL